MSLGMMQPCSKITHTELLQPNHPRSSALCNSMKENASLMNNFALQKMPSLQIQTNLFSQTDTPSPPPPVLYPANSPATHLLDCAFNQTSSPSPPVIVAELTSNASTSSKESSQKIQADTTTRSCITHSFFPPPCLPSRLGTVPRMNSISSSSSSSSPSTSSSSSSSSVSSIAHNDRSTGDISTTNGSLPILEKISRVLGSPNLNFNASPTVRLAAISPEELIAHQTSNHVVTGTKQNSPLLLKPKIEKPSTPFPKQNSPTAKTPVPSSKKIIRRRSSGRRGRQIKKKKIDSDSDFEVERIGAADGRISRGRAAAAQVVARTKKTAALNKRSRKPNASTQQPTGSSEASANRRYLESPFLCLCQSRGATVGLSQPSVQPLATDGAPRTSESITMSAALPAHVISPALCGSNVTQSANPSTCPVARGLSEEKSHADLLEHAETPSIFSGLTYRPSTQLRSREIPPLSEITRTHPWMCVFCAEDNTCLDLGPLYGPYWVSNVERLQLPTGMIALPTSNSPPDSKRSRKRVRSGVITSTVTRSAAAQGRSTVAKTGDLRLVIKAHTGSHQPPTQARISAQGEVWLHLDCLLWAPGACINGSGTISGLEEAIQLALDTTCSICDKRGAVLSCCYRGCSLSFHYRCAVSSDCQLNCEQFSLLCNKHKHLN